MSKNSTNFWNKTAEIFGHTGYQNQLIYNYDQPIRLKTVKKIIEKYFKNFNFSHKALDIGCGSGDFIELLSKYGFNEITGIDLSEVMVEKVRNRFKDNSKVRIELCDLNDLIKKDNTYDLILCITVFQHVVSDQKFDNALLKLHRILKPGGILISLDRLLLVKEQNIHKVENVTYLKTRSDQMIKNLLLKAEFNIISEPNFPQFAISINYWLHKFFIKISRKSQVEAYKNETITHKSSILNIVLKKFKIISTWLIQYFIFLISRPFDYWINLPIIPKSIRLYKLLVVQKPKN